MNDPPTSPRGGGSETAGSRPLNGSGTLAGGGLGAPRVPPTPSPPARRNLTSPATGPCRGAKTHGTTPPPLRRGGSCPTTSRPSSYHGPVAQTLPAAPPQLNGSGGRIGHRSTLPPSDAAPAETLPPPPAAHGEVSCVGSEGGRGPTASGRAAMAAADEAAMAAAAISRRDSALPV
ncbi:hypothetical protein I4F81_008336 [Pyropia yezoensis]|uniref:Uncharacterized protein n=1 Tax=Pyropia yezoensis TaxID=2788 RepID=A0ACC3C7G0_PYRYE|nr:hypothetical protein I4F81_008336 [Neopyropia yezoensis]